MSWKVNDSQAMGGRSLISYQRLRVASEESAIGLRDLIHGLISTFKNALDKDKLQGIKEINEKTLDTMRQYVSEHASQLRSP